MTVTNFRDQIYKEQQWWGREGNDITLRYAKLCKIYKKPRKRT